MAYTYDNILEEARKAGVLEKFSQEDHNTAQRNPEYGMSLVGLLKDANNATTEAQRLIATETVNQLRKSYGATGTGSAAVSGSFDGTQRLAAPEKAGVLASSDPTTYQTVLDDIVNQKEFTYDHENDPVYQAYAKTYLREGARASENALAQAAAMSGGRPSSYAISVAQQTGNQYAAALADMIPTLRQNAMAEHQNDIAAKYDILGALEAKQQTDYQKVLDEENRKRLVIQDALSKYQALGYATADVAQVLGIPEGTRFGEVPQTGGGTSVSQAAPLGGVLDQLLNGTKTDAPEKEALKNAGQVVGGLWGVGAGLQSTLGAGTQMGTGVQESGTSGTSDPTISNPMGGTGMDAWIQIGNERISLETLEKEMSAGRIIGRYDARTNTVTYERVSTTESISRPTLGGGKLNLVTNAAC